MLLTLTLVVFLATIATLFSQEFISLFKKIISIKGAELFLPLAAASWLIINFDFWFTWVLHYYRAFLNHLVKAVAWIMPSYPIFIYFSFIIVLTLISILPVLALDWIFRKKLFYPYPHPYLTSTLIWLISTITVIII
jgi:hypothetical protein